MSLLHRDRPVYQEGSPRRQGNKGPENAAGADAVFQTGKLVHGAGGVDRGGTAGPDWQRLRLPEPGSAAEGSHRGAPAPGQRPRLLPHGRQPGQGREARGAGLAEHGLPARAEDGETAEEERRWSRPTALATTALG